MLKSADDLSLCDASSHLDGLDNSSHLEEAHRGSVSNISILHIDMIYLQRHTRTIDKFR